MPNAICLVRRSHEYPHEAIVEGLKRCGFTVTFSYVELRRDDIVVTWTPWRESIAGAVFNLYRERTLVFENGYFPRDCDNNRYYCLGRGGFNGIGDHRAQDSSGDRWRKLGLPMGQIGRDETFCLILGQRGGPDPRWTMPYGWHKKAIAQAQLVFKDVRFRPHPARIMEHGKSCGVPLELGGLDDVLSRASHVLTWNSKSVCDALRMGCTVITAGPNSIAKGVAIPNFQFFHDVAYSQWTEDEIATGSPIRRML